MSQKEKSSLEEFIKTYISNKLISDTGQSYTSWVSKNGINSKAVYESELAEIDSDYMRQKSEYGAKAERLASLGLSSGGYSDYLNGKAYSVMQGRKSDAKDRYLENERKNRSEFSDYQLKNAQTLSSYLNSVQDQGKKQNSLYSDVVSEISGAGMTDFESAFEYAKNAGLDDALAESAAKTANAEAVKKRRNEIMQAIIKLQMSASQARQYSLGLGLSAEEAEEMALYAKSINSYRKTTD